MFKLANAGSKEQRELEKVMHNFEKALRESTEVSQNTQYSLSKDIENFDNSWYNEIDLPYAEQKRVQSEALTWNADKRNQFITQTLSNDITYRYMIDDEGIVHVYGRETAVNIHEREKEYDNTNGERPDSVVEELRFRQGNNGEHFDIGENRRNQGEDDTNDNYFVSGEGRSNGTGYSKNRTNVNRKPKGWHFNEDGSTEVTYSDGTKETEIAPTKEVSSTDDAFFDTKNPQYSLSWEGDNRTLGGGYRFSGKDLLKSEQDIAPVAKNATTNKTVDDIAPVNGNNADIVKSKTLSYSEEVKAVNSNDNTAPAVETKPRIRQADNKNTAPDGMGERSWYGTSTGSEAVDGIVALDDIPDDVRYYQVKSNKKSLETANARLTRDGFEKSKEYFEGRMSDRKLTVEDIALVADKTLRESSKKQYTCEADYAYSFSLLEYCFSILFSTRKKSPIFR